MEIVKRNGKSQTALTEDDAVERRSRVTNRFAARIHGRERMTKKKKWEMETGESETKEAEMALKA